MAEPTSGVATGVTIAAGAITLTGSIFGLQYDALLFGLLGGLLSLMHLPPMTALRVASTLASASVLGALFGPALIAAAQAQFSWIGAVPAQPARLGSAVIVGCFLQALIQLVMAWLQGRTKQIGGGA